MNLLKETIEELADNGKTAKDVLWVGNEKVKTTWKNFAEIADVEYDREYGSARVAKDLIIAGDDFWLERDYNDFAEWWDYRTMPKEPCESFALKALTVSQSEELGLNISYGDVMLLLLNGIK